MRRPNGRDRGDRYDEPDRRNGSRNGCDRGDRTHRRRTGAASSTEPTAVDLEQYPACILVTTEELDDITSMSWVNGPQSPPSPDQPSCTWDSDSDPREQGHLQISVVARGEFEVCTISPTAERVRGLGDRAVLDETGRRLCVLPGSRYLSIFTSFFPERNDYREVVIAIAEEALPRIDEVPS